MNPRLPLVVILGATGSGKTKLSLELAQRFSGEIIGADSMQIYKGLDIITAKATVEERTQVQHHLIDELYPRQEFTVIDFRNRALPIIDDIFARNKTPIIVGGTNYYIESLLWKVLIGEPHEERYCQPGIAPNNDHELPSTELHKKLLACDPVRACRLHPNDKRKILRSLEVFYQKGRKHSELLEEQQTSDGGSPLGGRLRYENALVFWLQCDQDVLDKRLDTRVDLMLEEGLVNELLDFHKRHNEQRLKTDENPDYTKGVFQSIGFKEFHKYLMLESNRSLDDGKALLQESIEDLKRATRRYARKQKRWITNRFLSKMNRKVPIVYGLDTTELSRWHECVSLPAVEVIESFLTGSPCNHQPLPLQDTQASPNSQANTLTCEVCQRIFIGKHQWDAHIKSHKHKRVLEWLKRQKHMERDNENK